MKRPVIFLLFLCSVMLINAQTPIYVSAGQRSETAILAENAATEKLRTLLAEGPITVITHDYGGFEKVGELPFSLPTDDSRITTRTGDIMLYLGDNIVFFYGSNTWSYTPLGRIEGLNAGELKEFLSADDGKITLSLSPASSAKAEIKEQVPEVYDTAGNRIILRGRCLDELPSGSYIVNGQKILK